MFKRKNKLFKTFLLRIISIRIRMDKNELLALYSKFLVTCRFFLQHQVFLGGYNGGRWRVLLSIGQNEDPDYEANIVNGSGSLTNCT